ncbi:hypothetical protein FBU30_003298, partial [Linnemannia zychae]
LLRDNIPNKSEAEYCCLWAEIAKVLLEGNGIQVRLGELGEQTTRVDRALLEGLYSGADLGVGSRKIDIFFCRKAKIGEDMLELASWK